jgi:hypothetical protein
MEAREAYDKGRFRLSRDEDVSVDVAGARLCLSNPRRVQVVVTNHGAGDVRVGFRPFASAATGLPVPANGGQVALNVETEGDACGRELFAISAAGTVSVHVLEWEVF